MLLICFINDLSLHATVLSCVHHCIDIFWQDFFSFEFFLRFRKGRMSSCSAVGVDEAKLFYWSPRDGKPLLYTLSNLIVSRFIDVEWYEWHHSTANWTKAPNSLIACPQRDRVILNRESYSVTFLTDRSACSLQHPESSLLLNAKLTETSIFRELSIEIESSLIELKSSLIQLKSSLIQLESSLIQLESSLIQLLSSLYLYNERAH